MVRGRAFVILCVLGVSAAAVSVGCRKNTVPSPVTRDAAAAPITDEEAFALCREIFPCAPGQVDMCAVDGARSAPATYRAPGVRIERLACTYTRMGEEAVIGVPDDGSVHLRHADLFGRVRGTPDERARAAAELVVERPLASDATTPCAAAVDEQGVLRFCVRGEPADSDALVRCLALPSGAVSCTRDGTERALTACRRSFGGERVVAKEMFASAGTLGAVASGTYVIASDHAIGGSSTGASAQPLRGAGLHVRQAQCSPSGAYPFRYAHWGEADDGTLVFGKDLIARLDTVVMRAGLAFDLALAESEVGTYLLLDPIGGADAMVVPGDRGCALPPGPRQEGTALSFYTSHAGRSGPTLRHCRVSVATGRGICGSVTPGTFC